MSVTALRPSRVDDTAQGPKYEWPTAGPVRRSWVVAVFVVGAVIAAATAVFSTDSPHRVWGVAAAVAYGLAAAAAAAWRPRGLDVALLCGLGHEGDGVARSAGRGRIPRYDRWMA